MPGTSVAFPCQRPVGESGMLVEGSSARAAGAPAIRTAITRAHEKYFMTERNGKRHATDGGFDAMRYCIDPM